MFGKVVMCSLLTPRLSLIASKVPRGASVVDVGSDHAYIPIHLIKNNIAKRAIASDINEGPIKIAEENIKRHGLSERIKTFLSDGLKSIPKELYDTVIIAGMGGILISEIIENGTPPPDTLLILQPMTAVKELRQYLYANGYEILDEELASEGDKIYNVLVVKKGIKTSFEDIDLYIGRKLILKNDPLLPALIERQIKKTSIKVRGLEKGGYYDEAGYYKGLLSKLLEFQNKGGNVLW